VLLTKYYSGDQINRTEMDRECSLYGERRGEYRVLVGKLEGGRPLRRSRRRLANNIEMGPREVG
jgi:hypothetical protein